MKKVLLFLCLLPFSLFGELTPSDLSDIENKLEDIRIYTGQTEECAQQSVTHLQYIRTMTYEILTILDNANIGDQLGDIRNKLTGISNRAQTIIDQLNEFLPQIKSELTTANTSLALIQTEISYLDDRLETFQSETYQWLQSIDYKLSDIKTAITDGFENLNNAMTSLQAAITTIFTTLESLNTTVQDIYTELLSQGYDIKDIKEILKSSLTGEKRYIAANYASMYETHAFDTGPLNYAPLRIQVHTATNLFMLIDYQNTLLRSILPGITYEVLNTNARLYDIQTNLYTIVSALTDKTQEQQITNQFDNVSNTFKGDIKQEYEGSEDDLNDLEGKIKAENQSFKQNQSKVQQFESLVSSFQVDSLPSFATISIVNFKLGEDSSLPSQSSIEIDVLKFEIVFRVVRGCFTIVYWGIVLFLGYKITFFFVRFVRSNVLGIIPSTNKTDDGSFS